MYTHQNFICLFFSTSYARTVPNATTRTLSYIVHIQSHLVHQHKRLLLSIFQTFSRKRSVRNHFALCWSCATGIKICAYSPVGNVRTTLILYPTGSDTNPRKISFPQALLKRHAEPLEARAGRLDIRRRDRDMAEPARFGIARVVLHLGFVLCIVIVGKLEDA
jgi:hypothetical protein